MFKQCVTGLCRAIQGSLLKTGMAVGGVAVAALPMTANAQARCNDTLMTVEGVDPMDQAAFCAFWVDPLLPDEPRGDCMEWMVDYRLSDPVYFPMGDFRLKETDLVIPGRGLHFALTRVYRSNTGGTDRHGIVGPLGNNWDHSYNQYVSTPISMDDVPGGLISNPFGILLNTLSNELSTSLAVEFVTLSLGDGRRDTFMRYTGYDSATSQITPQTEFIPVRNTLSVVMTVNGSGEYQLKEADGTVRTFNSLGLLNQSRGKLKSMEDRHGNEMKFEYDSNGRLTTVIDTFGREITFAYNGSGLLQTVTDHAGREVAYDYYGSSDTDGNDKDLKSVTLPEIKNDPSNGYPLDSVHRQAGMRSVWSYTYQKASSGLIDDKYETNLLTITDPRGTQILENTYLPYSSGNHLDWIVSQKYGDVGDTFTGFDPGQYDFVWTTNGSNWELLESVTINNRVGQVKFLDFDANTRQVKAHEDYITLATSDDAPSAVVNGVGWNGSAPAPYTAGTNMNLGDGHWGAGITTMHDDDSTDNPDRTYQVIRKTLQDGTYVTMEYEGVTDPTGDPRRRANKTLQRTYYDKNRNGAIDPASEFITESWEYDFTLGASGGCGCGSSFATSYTDPRGYETQYEFDVAGNLVTITYPVVTDLPPGAPTQYAEEEFTYNTYGQRIRHYHAKNNGTTRIDRYEYTLFLNPETGVNEPGYLLKTIVDEANLALTTEFTYNHVGQPITREDPNKNIFEMVYNQRGSLVQESYTSSVGTIRDYYNRDYFYDRNLNLVRTEVANLDATGAVVSGNPAWTTIHEYSPLNRRYRTAVETEGFAATAPSYSSFGSTMTASAYSGNAGKCTIQESVLDKAERVTTAKSPIAVAGIQTGAVTDYVYDSRDLVIELVEAPSVTTVKRVIQYEYDDRGRKTKDLFAVDSGVPYRTAEYHYDGLSRLWKQTGSPDSMDSLSVASYTLYFYDDSSNVTEVQFWGELVEGDGTNVMLEKSTTDYDQRNRPYRQWQYWFNRATQAAIDGTSDYSETLTHYDEDSTVQGTIDARGLRTDYTYDSATRLYLVADSEYNTNTITSRDANGNVLESERIEIRSTANLLSITSADMQVFETISVYDDLNRMIRQEDNLGNRSLYSYDSRNNTLQVIDPRDNSTQYTYDGLSRLLQEDVKMTASGAGGASIDTITTKTEYDANSRVTARIDDNNHRTEYDYDELGRQTMITYADGTTETTTYDRSRNPISTTDANGTVISKTFDRLDRLTAVSVTPATGVSTGRGFTVDVDDFYTTSSYTWDGASNMISATNETATVEMVYDSKGQLSSETITFLDESTGLPMTNGDYTTTYAYDLAGNMTEMVYPGGRVVEYIIDDDISRTESIKASSPTGGATATVVDIDYWGPTRVTKKALGNGLQTRITYGGYDGDTSSPAGNLGLGLPHRIEHVSVDVSDNIIEHKASRTMSWDDGQNKSERVDLNAAGGVFEDQAYSYDSANRLIETDVTVNNARTTTYTLDGVHNRVGGGYSMDSGLPLKDAEVNQYTTAGLADPMNPSSLAYDENGNLVLLTDACQGDINGDHAVNLLDLNLVLNNFGEDNPAGDANGDGDTTIEDLNLVNGNFGAACDYEDYRYDYMNRLTSFVAGSDNGSSGHTVQEHEYRYDALGRRVISRKDLGETYGKNTRFIYGGAMSWQLLEEYEEDFPTDLQSSHVYCGHAMDDVLMYSFDAPGAGGFEDYYIHADEQLTVMAVSDDTGTIQERYRYTDYGTPTFFDGGGVTVLTADPNTDRISSAIGNRHLYTGQIFDEETGLSQYRYRYLHHGLGRFVTRDPSGYIDGMSLVAYVASSPLTAIDPLGLMAVIPDNWSEDRFNCSGTSLGMYSFLDLTETLKIFYDSGLYRRVPCSRGCAPGQLRCMAWVFKFFVWDSVGRRWKERSDYHIACGVSGHDSIPVFNEPLSPYKYGNRPVRRNPDGSPELLPLDRWNPTDYPPTQEDNTPHPFILVEIIETGCFCSNGTPSAPHPSDFDNRHHEREGILIPMDP